MLCLMARYVFVQFYGRDGGDMPPPVKIKADAIEKASTDGLLRLKLGTEIVGEVNAASVAGWWIEESSRL